MATQQIVILSDDPPPASSGMAAIGKRKELLRDLAAYNTGPSREGEDTLYGPGIRIDLAPEQDPITQMLLTIDDEDIAWPVIMRLAKKFRWKLFDPMSGRELRAS